MQKELLQYLRCPVSKEPLTLTVIATAEKKFKGNPVEVIKEGLLTCPAGFIYPIINFIPRMLVESFIDYRDFIKNNYTGFDQLEATLLKDYNGVIEYAVKKNTRTKKSFTKEWSIYNYDVDKTWDADDEEMVKRFLRETDETFESIKGKLIFDGGCGNGKLNAMIADVGGIIIGSDLSNSVERAYQNNDNPNAYFVQGDVMFPSFDFNQFDIVQSCGVIIATVNPELSFSILHPLVKKSGKISVWLYHPRRDWTHSVSNFLREYTSKLPLTVQYYLYRVTLFPLSYIIKKIKGNKQTANEMMIDIMDWFSPEYRWEIEHDAAKNWFTKRDYTGIKVTTDEPFGFNIIGVKKELT